MRTLIQGGWVVGFDGAHHELIRDGVVVYEDDSVIHVDKRFDGQVMLLYLDTTFDRFKAEGRMRNRTDLYWAIHEGAVKRIRPKTMTVATDMIGLLPLLWATGTGADVTRRLVAPLIGGITISFVMELLVYPVVFYLYKRWELRHEWGPTPSARTPADRASMGVA